MIRHPSFDHLRVFFVDRFHLLLGFCCVILLFQPKSLVVEALRQKNATLLMKVFRTHLGMCMNDPHEEVSLHVVNGVVSKVPTTQLELSITPAV